MKQAIKNNPKTALPPARARSRQRGFILTIELLLLVTILIIGSLVGLVAVRDALFKRYVSKQSQTAIISDSGGKVLGEAVGFDEHDAPRLFYIDRSLETAQRTLISVRDDRFTSREPIYYAGGSCSGTPCIKSVSDEAGDNTGVDGIDGSGSVSYFNALQGQPNYAIGQGDGGVKGALFRESAQSCPVGLDQIGSRWISQKVVMGTPCEVIDMGDAATEPAYSACLISLLEPCSCPQNYEDEGDVLANNLPLINATLDGLLGSVNQLLLPLGQRLPNVDIGTLCCPAMMTLQEDQLINTVVFTAITQLLEEINLGALPVVEQSIERLLAPLQGEVLCESAITFKLAESVPSADDPDRNALDGFTPPFQINQPGGSTAGNDWYSTPPPGEGRSTR